MDSIDQKAEQLIAEAGKKLNIFSFFSIFFNNKTSRIENAIDCYQRAGNLLKTSKNWLKAAECFVKSAELNQEIDNRFDSAINYVNASNCFKKCNTMNAIACLEKSIEIFTDLGRFSTAAKYHQIIAEIYELQLFELKNAIAHYEQASEFFKSEENNASSDACMLKIAHYAAMFEDYQKAIEIYQQIALAHIGGTLLKHNVKAYLFKAALCHVCADILSLNIVIIKYAELFPSFEDSNECKFLIELRNTIENDDLNGFLSIKENFISKFRCDDLVRTLLTRIEAILSNGIELDLR